MPSSVLSAAGRLLINGGCAKDALIATEKDHSGGFYRPSGEQTVPRIC